jgi:hypothetical protein
VREISHKADNTTAVDFDGVIHGWRGTLEPPGDDPVPGALEALGQLVSRSHPATIRSPVLLL